DDDVGDDAEGEEVRAVEEAQIAELVRVGDQDSRETARHQERGRDQGEELAGAGAQLFCACLPLFWAPVFFLAGARAPGGGGSPSVGLSLMSLIKSVASPLPRRVWPVTAFCRSSESVPSCTGTEYCFE